MIGVEEVNQVKQNKGGKESGKLAKRTRETDLVAPLFYQLDVDALFLKAASVRPRVTFTEAT